MRTHDSVGANIEVCLYLQSSFDFEILFLCYYNSKTNKQDRLLLYRTYLLE